MHETVQMQQREKKALNLFSFFFFSLGGVFGSNCSLILTVPSRPTFLTKKNSYQCRLEIA